MVTTPGRPAFAITSASFSCCFALSPDERYLFNRETISEDSTEAVPTKWAHLFRNSSISSIKALNFAS